jgi:diguanylate cyclase (GGDEF)-like protein
MSLTQEEENRIRDRVFNSVGLIPELKVLLEDIISISKSDLIIRGAEEYSILIPTEEGGFLFDDMGVVFEGDQPADESIPGKCGLADIVLKTKRSYCENESSRPRIASLLATPITYKDGVVGVIELFNKPNGFTPSDIERLEALGEYSALLIHVALEFIKASSRDPLTRSYNRGFFEQRLDEEGARAKRYARPLSLIYFDIDNFREINKVYGHPAGAFVLQELSRLLQGRIRRSDIYARIGGDEFAIILPETRRDGVTTVGNGIVSDVEGHTFEYEDRLESGKKIIPITISAGGATYYPGQDFDKEQLKQMADKSLYQAKDLGKSQFVLKD